jgi:thiamine-phosphate pyrophosphorylase
MIPELYLIAPPDAAADDFAACLKRVLAATEIAALLLPQGVRSEGDYAAFAAAIVPVAQAAGVAVLLEGDPARVRALGADGLHVEGPAAALKKAVAALKPDLIVGAGGSDSRHDAMSKAELGPDYIMFGSISGAMEPEVRELAGWWAQTMETPGVLSDPAADAASADAEGCEFLALSKSIWSAADPVAAVAAIAARLGEAG